jgi:beta-glucosidase
MLRDLQARGIKVCLTLNHWVVPQWFAEQDSWLGPDAMQQWTRFVERVVPVLAPGVDIWITLNEPMVPVLAGYLGGYHPPAETNPLRAAKVFARLLEAHAIAYRFIKATVPTAAGGGPTQVGYAHAYQWVEPFHERGWQRPAEQVASKAIAWVGFEAWDRALRTGRVPLPWGRGQRIEHLGKSYDFVGVNYYMRISARLHAKAISNVKSGEFDVPEGIETTGMGWQVYPPGLRKVLERVWRTQGKPIWITENGCCDIGDGDGDTQRRRYLLSHLSQVQQAIASGVDVRGYLLWSFMDNFEWREGFAKRFGIVAMDHDDPALERRPRPSAEMYRQVIEENAVTPEIVAAYAPGALDRWG